jgi:hypothetical protein
VKYGKDKGENKQKFMVLKRAKDGASLYVGWVIADSR